MKKEGKNKSGNTKSNEWKIEIKIRVLNQPEIKLAVI